MSASETHSLANLRMRPEDSLQQIRQISDRVGSDASVNASVSTAFGCPFDGHITERQVFALVDRLASFGIRSITLCDTTGMANPSQVRSLCTGALQRWTDVTFTAHFHNTRGMGLVNVLAAFDAGIVHFDASLGGLGGCPYAPGASGNICTEDLVHMLQMMGYDTGVDLDLLLGIASDLPAIVGHDIPGQVIKAGTSDRRYPRPDWLESGE